jgi:CHAT domain-containing protein
LSDGVIEAREILGLDLHAQLVVLSACETGLGSVTSGEGLIRLSWAFLVAGSPSAVVSQWKVDSRSTGELMAEFHRAYRAGGYVAARALQRAALATMRAPGYHHPFYWAPFVVLGAGY